MTADFVNCTSDDIACVVILLWMLCVVWLGYYIPVSGSSGYSLTCAAATVAGAASCSLDLPAGLIGLS